MGFRGLTDEERSLRSYDDYNNQLAQANALESRAKSAPTGLGAILSGIGEKVGDFFGTVGNVVQTGAGAVQNNATDFQRRKIMDNASAARNEIAKRYGFASYADALSDANADKLSDQFWSDIKNANNQTKEDITSLSNDFRNSELVKDIQSKDLNKAKGQALSTIGTVFDFAPGFGVAGNVISGAFEGVGDTYKNASANGNTKDDAVLAQGGLADALTRAAINAGTAGVTGGIANRLGAGKTLLGSVGKSALTGAAGGALSAGATDFAQNQDLGSALGAAVQGAQTGALGGAVMGGANALANKAVSSLRNKTPQMAVGATQRPIVDETANMGAEAKAPKVQDIAQDADIDQPKKGNLLGRALKNTGETLETAQTNLTRAERNRLGIKNTGEVVDAVRKRTGITSVQDQAEFAKNITGAGDASVMDTIQKRNMSVDVNGRPLTLTEDKYNVAVNEAVGDNWRKSTMGESYDQFKDDLLADIKATDPISAANRLKADARKFRAAETRTGDPKSGVKAKIYTEVANKLDELSYSAVPEKNVNRMFDDTIDEFRMRAKEAQAQGNKKYAKAYENLAKELEETPRTIKAFRSFKKDFVDASNVAEISAGARSGSLEAGISRGRNIKDRVLNTLLMEPADRAMAWAGGKLSDVGDAINGQGAGITGAIGNIADKVGNFTAGANTNNDIAQRVNRAAIRNASESIGRQTEQANNNEQIMNEANQLRQDAKTQYALQQQQLAARQVSPAQEQLNRIANAMSMALNAGDMDAYSKLAELYNQAYKMYGASTTGAATGQAEKLTDNQTKALTGLQQLDQLASMAPGVTTALANSPLGGLVNMFGGDQYANQAQSLALTLGYLQSGANVSQNEAQRIGESYIPTAFDSEQTRQEKLDRARNLLNNYLYGTQYYQG